MDVTLLYSTTDLYIGNMDFTKLNRLIERIASQHDLPVEMVVERWLERQTVSNLDGWKNLDGIPCIVGGLLALLGEFYG